MTLQHPASAPQCTLAQHGFGRKFLSRIDLARSTMSSPKQKEFRANCSAGLQFVLAWRTQSLSLCRHSLYEYSTEFAWAGLRESQFFESET